MKDQLPSLYAMLASLQQVPYLASKNVYKVALHLLSMDDASFDRFVSAIRSARTNLSHCLQCYGWCERGGSCMFCTDSKRKQGVICVVESWQDVLVIERTQGYDGVYHILGGVICPLEGIGPEHLSITPLVERVTQKKSQEVILATNQTPEGEATAAFIAKKIPHNVSVTRLARGVPVGSSLEYMDRVTVHKALTERRPF